MNVIYLLIPLAILFVIIGIAAFFWAVRNNQFEDLEGPAHSILFDDPPPKNPDKPEDKGSRDRR